MALKQAGFDRAAAKRILKICIPMGFQYSDRKFDPAAFRRVRDSDGDLYRTKYRGGKDGQDKRRTDFSAENMRRIFAVFAACFLGLRKNSNEYLRI